MQVVINAIGLFIIFVWMWKRIPYIKAYMQGRAEGWLCTVTTIKIYCFLFDSDFFTDDEIFDIKGMYDFLMNCRKMLCQHDILDVLGIYANLYGKLKNIEDASTDNKHLVIEFTKH